MVKGIGPIYAKKLVVTFGDRIFDIIEQESVRLEDVDGIGPKRRKRIKEAWAEQKVIRQGERVDRQEWVGEAVAQLKDKGTVRYGNSWS